MVTIRDMRPPEHTIYGHHRRGLHNFCESLYGEVKLLVEVGSWKGESACIFAQYVRQVLCVDSWEHGLPENSPYTFDDVMAEFVNNTLPYGNIAYCRNDSVSAARLFPIESIDAVYIDASHQYRNVLSDIAAWYPIVKQGGIIAGHDYDMDGVSKAVNELLGKPNAVYSDNTWKITKR